jgi:hypothetical protein
LCNPDVQYGALTDPRTGDNAAKQIILQIEAKDRITWEADNKIGKQIERWKDGEYGRP